jgi:hypothetical protein
VIPEDRCSRRVYKEQVQIAEGKQNPPEETVSESAPPAAWQQELRVFDRENQESCGRSGAPPLRDYLETISGEFLQTVERETAIVVRIFVEGMAEWRHEVDVAPRHNYARYFGHDAIRMADVFQHSVALDGGKGCLREGKKFSVGDDIDFGSPEQVEIDISFDASARAANVKIPPAQRKIVRLAGIVNQRERRLEGPVQAISEAASSAALVSAHHLVAAHVLQPFAFLISSTRAGTASNRSPTMP